MRAAWPTGAPQGAVPGGAHLDLGEQRRVHPVVPAGQRLPDAGGEPSADGGALPTVQLRGLTGR
ncbi:hypothetical protein [Streptomyces violaceus]|uniref:hypothetical protein n=1 Tax=Streptomyces violaceus TaxID=1936 RepID=UPI00074B01BD|nr:hypothetical protein ACZ90_43270 [Streptomyces albus subsp. albus]